MARYDRIRFENARLDYIGYWGTVVYNKAEKAFFKAVLWNEDGTVWAKRFGRLVVLKRDPNPSYGPERTSRWFYSPVSNL